MGERPFFLKIAAMFYSKICSVSVVCVHVCVGERENASSSEGALSTAHLRVYIFVYTVCKVLLDFLKAKDKLI